MFSGFNAASSSPEVRTASPTAQEPSATPNSNALQVSAPPQPVKSTITDPFETRSSSKKPENGSYRHSAYDSDMEVKAMEAVRASFRDPDSTKFKDVCYGDSKETGPAIFGRVNSKNAFGGYSGFVKFVSNGTTTLIGGRDPKTDDAWSNLYFAAVTEKTLAELPQSSRASPAKVDVLKVAGKTVKEVNAILGQPSSQEKIPEGNAITYKNKEVEVVFQTAKANLITVSNLESVPFTPSAITVLGLPLSKPSFASEFCLKWQNIPGIAEISIFKGQQGCDFAYIIVQERKK